MKVYIKWHRAIQDAKHRPMRNCSEQVLNSYPPFFIKTCLAFPNICHRHSAIHCLLIQERAFPESAYLRIHQLLFFAEISSTSCT